MSQHDDLSDLERATLAELGLSEEQLKRWRQSRRLAMGLRDAPEMLRQIQAVHEVNQLQALFQKEAPEKC